VRSLLRVKVAVIGASGFVGGHVLRGLRAEGIDARAVVRNPRSLPRESDRRVADARDVYAIRDAIAGCDYVVHSIVGPPDVILGTLAPVYAAAEATGVRRMVYMSTGSVHGQRPKPGTDEKSALTVRHAFPYNTAKVRAERKLRRLRARGTVELVMLRPTIVFGPGSRWIVDFAAGLFTGTAYVIDGARGICNSIYVDNLAYAVRAALATPAIDGEVFLVGDEETVTWADLYRPMASGLGFDFDAVPSFSPPDVPLGVAKAYVDAIRSSELGQALIARLPPGSKALLRTAIRAARSRGARAPAPHVVVSANAGPTPTPEMIALHRCAWRLPNEHARRVLGYRPPVSFAEGCRRSVNWLATEWLPSRAPR
jgi:nucleoside-diphosphate-sugar epimerase